MAQPTTTFLDELVAAVRGCVALLLGRREAPGYFDFSQRGLAGSFIALVVAFVLNGVIGNITAPPQSAGSFSESIIISLVAYAAQAGAAWLTLRQMGRQDGFVPYIVASNWVALAIVSLLFMALFSGPLAILMLALAAALAIASFINIGRFIVTLSPLQIVLLFLAEFAGAILAVGLIVLMLPMPAVPAV